jgi:hypothetical protein
LRQDTVCDWYYDANAAILFVTRKEAVMVRRLAERIIGVVITFAGLTLFVFGSLPLLALVSALVTGKPSPDHGGNSGILIGGGLAIMAYGWHCFKGFRNK